MKAAILFTAIALSVSAVALDAQVIGHRSSVIGSENRQPITVTQNAFFQRTAPHYGKWLTAATTLGLTLLGAEQHRLSRRQWDALLEICRSAEDACALASDGRYVRTDAEQLYQRSRAYDRRANRWLLGAQASLLVTTALFIIDLHPGEGPDNIPLAPLRVGMRLQF